MEAEKPSKDSEELRREGVARETENLIQTLPFDMSDLRREVRQLSQVGENWDG